MMLGRSGSRGAAGSSSGGGGSSSAPWAYLAPVPAVNDRFGCTTAVGQNIAALTLNRLQIVPVIVPVDMTVDRLSFEINTGIASGSCRVGIYNSTDQKPGTLVLDAGAASTVSGGAVNVTISQALTAGLYWLAYAAQTASATIRIFGNVIGFTAVGTGSVGILSYSASWYVDSVSGALPASPTWLSQVNASNLTPALELRRSA